MLFQCKEADMAQFSDIFGNEQTKQNLKKSIAENNVTQAYLFHGESGVGKSLVVSVFAEALLCTGDGDKPCGRCISCTTLEKENHPDVKKITSPKKTIGIDVIREQLNSDIFIKPYGDKKIYIIDNAQTLTPAAQNALLKTIEEPPSYAIIILVANGTNMLLSTVLSRVNNIWIKPVNKGEMSAYLGKMKITGEATEFFSEYARGNIGRFHQLYQDENFKEMRTFAVDFLVRLSKKDINEVLESFKEIEKYKDKILTLFEIWQIFFRDCLMLKEGLAQYSIQKDKINEMRTYTEKTEVNSLINRLEALSRAEQGLEVNANFQLTIELLLLRIRQS